MCKIYFSSGWATLKKVCGSTQGVVQYYWYCTTPWFDFRFCLVNLRECGRGQCVSFIYFLVCFLLVFVQWKVLAHPSPSRKISDNWKGSRNLSRHFLIQISSNTNIYHCVHVRFEKYNARRTRSHSPELSPVQPSCKRLKNKPEANKPGLIFLM